LAGTDWHAGVITKAGFGVIVRIEPASHPPGIPTQNGANMDKPGDARRAQIFQHHVLID